MNLAVDQPGAAVMEASPERHVVDAICRAPSDRDRVCFALYATWANVRQRRVARPDRDSLNPATVGRIADTAQE
jgi:hypothetical protein